MDSDQSNQWRASACRAVIEISLARHGRLTRASVALGYERSHLAKHLRSARHLNLYRLLAGLEIDPVRFARYAHAFDHEPVLEQFGVEALNLATRRPTLLRRAGPVLCRFLDGELDDDVQSFDELEALDARIQSEPEHLAEIVDRATEQAHAACSAAYAARALGIAASALRTLGRADESQVSIWVAMRLAGVHHDGSELAALMRYAVYLLSDRTAFRSAVDFMSVALRLCREASDEDGEGRSLAIRGLMRRWDGSLREADEDLSSSVRRLDARSQSFMCMALQNLAFVAIESGELRAADAFATRAARWAGRGLPAFKLDWLRGRLAFNSGRLVDAEKLLARAAAGLSVIPIDKALVGLEHARTLLLLGRVGDARQRLDQLRRVVVSLESESTRATAALCEVILQEGEAQTALLATISVALHEIASASASPTLPPLAKSH